MWLLIKIILTDRSHFRVFLSYCLCQHSEAIEKIKSTFVSVFAENLVEIRKPSLERTPPNLLLI